MLSESIDVCNQLLELKKVHLKGSSELYEKYKDSHCFNTLKFLEWKSGKSTNEVRVFEMTFSIMLDYFRKLYNDVKRLEWEISIIEDRLKSLDLLNTLPMESMKHT